MSPGARTSTAPGTTLHASCVALNGKGVLILGASGSGKSSLALTLMGFNADLVADDRTDVFVQHGQLKARSPTAISGLIEARGVGLINADVVAEAAVSLIVDLDHTETDRLPPFRKVTVLGISVPCLHKVEMPAFPAAILQYLKAGRRDP